MNLNLKQILDLVGKLDDIPGDDTPRERFRRYVKQNVHEVGQIRDYIGECLRNKGDQYNFALQDLINYLGCFLEFDVKFGRYRGTSGEIGFDGHWKSPTGFHIVVEVKKTEVYNVKTATLIGYVNNLISEKDIPDWGHALGLYIIGNLDPEIRQIENDITAEKKLHQLRIISVESLLSLVEMMNEYDVNHDNILALLKPSRPTIDPVVDLMTRLVAQEKLEIVEVTKEDEKEVTYWLTPVKGDEEQITEEIVQNLVEKEKVYAFGERTPGRKSLKPGDSICFYASGKGVIAHAKVISYPQRRKSDKRLRHPELYPWLFELDNVSLYLDNPVVIDVALRSKLDAFKNRDPNESWGWFVQSTRKITKDDFNKLTLQ